MIVIGRPYDNNKTVLALLLSRLVALFQEHGFSWGTMPYYHLTDLLQSGFIGNCRQAVREEEQNLHSIAFWMPPTLDLPYVDGNFEWDTVDSDFIFLKARIHRWFF